MPGIDQYLRLGIAGADFLLHSAASITIEQRETLEHNPDSASGVAAWRNTRNGRWPAYCVDAELRPSRRDGWQRAVFINASPHPVGLIVDDVQLLPQADVGVEPFTPLGRPPTRGGHVFAAAWVQGASVILVLEPAAMVAYLRSLGE